MTVQCAAQAADAEALPCPEAYPGRTDAWCWPCYSAVSLAVPRGLTLEDLPADHPIRQDHAHLTVRLALAEGRIQQALERLESEARHSWRRDRVGQLLEGLGCILTGRSSGWWPT